MCQPLWRPHADLRSQPRADIYADRGPTKLTTICQRDGGFGGGLDVGLDGEQDGEQDGGLDG